jgi:site-specific DNA-methyltransferase (adenine-specific)
MGREWDGADGFRRSLNAADAGRDSVFGRTSRTSPEYKTGKPSGARIRQASEGDQSSGRAHNATTSLVARNAPEAYVAGPLFQRWCEAWARECLRVLKPGGYLLAFGGTRTWHRLVCGIEDAGFEIRDSTADLTGYDAPGLMWVYGQGFPKSRNISADIDRKAGAEREVIGLSPHSHNRSASSWQAEGGQPHGMVGRSEGERLVTAPATGDAARWEGWGTALKPGWEPICVARKSLAGTVAQNVLTYGTGALNVDGCLVEGAAGSGHWIRNGEMGTRGIYGQGGQAGEDFGSENPAGGRWPPNVVLGESAAVELDRQSGFSSERARVLYRNGERQMDGWGLAAQSQGVVHGDSGGASRFFPVFRYQAKAATAERTRLPDGSMWPTVKPVPLMQWLVRLVTPPDGTVLDLFGGTGPTGEACVIEGFNCILLDRDPQAIAHARIRLAKMIQPSLFRPDDSAPAAPVRPVAASRPKPQPEVHPSLFDLEAS